MASRRVLLIDDEDDVREVCSAQSGDGGELGRRDGIIRRRGRGLAASNNPTRSSLT